MEETSDNDRSECHRPPPPKAFPWLVFPSEYEQAFFNLCEPKNRTCRKSIPEMMNYKRYWQKPSHQGWLVMLSHCSEDANPRWKFGDCFLWNPISLETIQLPTLLHWLNKSDQYEILDCVLSSPPKTNNLGDHDNDQSGSMVFILVRGLDESHEQILLFCRPSEDEQWRTKKVSSYIIDNNPIRSLLFFKGKLYCMCYNLWHLEIEIQHGHDGNDDDDETLSIRSFRVSIETPYYPSARQQFSLVEITYIESCGELFKIIIYYNPTEDWHSNVVTSVKVTRLDFSLKVWEKVKSLGDNVLFLGTNTTASCSAAELGLSRGCLYFTQLRDQRLYKFEVEDNAITIFSLRLKLPRLWLSADWMMMPMTDRVADGRRGRMGDMVGKDKEEEDNLIKVEENKTSINSIKKENQGQNHCGGELEEARPAWGILTNDMVALIASYLHSVDYICFRAVCKANQSIIPADTTCLSPWLVFSTNNDAIYNFVDPMHNNKKYLMNLSELLVGATIRYSKGGWLLMSKGWKTLFFYNPFTRAMIQLPDLKEIYFFTGMSFSSSPTSSNCVILGITDSDMYNDISMVVIERGNNSWRSQIFTNNNLHMLPRYINNPVFYNGAFYYLDYSGNLGVFDSDDFVWKVLVNPQEHFNDVYQSFLVECDGKLLSVEFGLRNKLIGIFRLDFSSMVWVKVKSLGKHMLFISDASCLSTIAPYSHMENKIFFSKLRGGRILYYSLDTGKSRALGSRLHSAQDFCGTTEWLNCTWIEPSWSQTTKQELDWCWSL